VTEFGMMYTHAWEWTHAHPQTSIMLWGVSFPQCCWLKCLFFGDVSLCSG